MNHHWWSDTNHLYTQIKILNIQDGRWDKMSTKPFQKCSFVFPHIFQCDFSQEKRHMLIWRFYGKHFFCYVHLMWNKAFAIILIKKINIRYYKFASHFPEPFHGFFRIICIHDDIYKWRNITTKNIKQGTLFLW